VATHHVTEEQKLVVRLSHNKGERVRAVYQLLKIVVPKKSTWQDGLITYFKHKNA